MTQQSRDSYVFFYDHVVTDDNPYELAVYSQWYPLPFTDPSPSPLDPHPDPALIFKTTEHYMMHHKALVFEPSRALEIAHSATPAEAKRIGRELKGFNRAKWDPVADGIVQRGNYLKFGQNNDGRAKSTVLATKGRTLVEASSTDRIWGIGYDAEHAWDNRDKWGTNRMGLALTRARDQLMDEGYEK